MSNPIMCSCGSPATHVTEGQSLHCLACHIIALGPRDNSEWDVDLRTTLFGKNGGDDECRIKCVEVEIRRGVSRANADRPGWRYADLEFVDKSIQVKFNGMSVRDLDSLSKFLADYAQRMRDF